jgi:predicted 3-demethylubiquinone-9 3-methyltransferase (glyoxalase superfamily)
MQKLTPFLWFDGQAEEAMTLYTSVFKDSKVGKVVRMPEGGPAPAGQVLTCSFELNGIEFTALNGGPHYKFTPAVSFQIPCETQDEVDHYWNKLSEGGRADRCGWLTDKFGLSWQVVPNVLPRLLGDPDTAKSGRVMAAMMQMSKLDISELEAAAKG